MPRRPDMPCSGCGKLMWRGGTSRPEGQARCRECQKAELSHGTYAMYKKRGCRCDDCRAANAAGMRDYAAKRRAEGAPLHLARRRTPRTCGSCGVGFLANLSNGPGKYCSVRCALDAQGRSPAPRFRIGKLARLAIYEAAGWTCQLCFFTVDPSAHYLDPSYPTLDHIVPRARGGSDDVENLRLACRGCNVSRKTNVDWVPEVVNSGS